MRSAAPSEHGTVTAAWLAALLEDAEDRFDAKSFLESHRLTWNDLAGPDARIPTSVIIAAWSQVPHELGDEAYGIRVARRAPVGTYFMLEQLCQACATLGEALTVGARYYGSMSDLTSVGAEVGADVFRLEQRVPAPIRNLRHAWENFLARVLLGLRHMSGVALVAQRITFVHAAPPAGIAVEEARDLFGVPPVYGAPSNLLELDPSAASLATTTANRRIFEILRRHAEALRPEEESRAWTTRVRAILDLDTTPADPKNIDRCASAFGTSARTLQRRLRDEGSSFEIVCRQSLQARAEAALLMTQQSVDSIARSLGFATGGSFARAFLRWTGTSPSEFRSKRKDQQT